MSKRSSRVARAAKVAVRGVELGAAVVSGPSGLVAAPGAAMDLFEAVRELVADDRQRKINELMTEAYYANAPTAGAALEIRALLERPDFRRVVIEAVQAKLNSVADEVTVPLAMLMREYERTELPPDWFFRGVCRVLQDLSADELSELRSLIDCMFRSLANESIDRLLVTVGNGVRLDIVHDTPRDSISYLAEVPIGARTTRLLTLMSANGLGIATTAGADLQWRVETDTLRRLRALLVPGV
jgi:hypothetical protein